MKKILMVLTSHDKLGGTGKATGFWLEEFTTPYYVGTPEKNKSRAGSIAAKDHGVGSS